MKSQNTEDAVGVLCDLFVHPPKIIEIKDQITFQVNHRTSRGVTFDVQEKLWRARVWDRRAGKRRCLGRFPTEAEAARAYDCGALLLRCAAGAAAAAAAAAPAAPAAAPAAAAAPARALALTTNFPDSRLPALLPRFKAQPAFARLVKAAGGAAAGAARKLAEPAAADAAAARPEAARKPAQAAAADAAAAAARPEAAGDRQSASPAPARAAAAAAAPTERADAAPPAAAPAPAPPPPPPAAPRAAPEEARPRLRRGPEAAPPLGPAAEEELYWQERAAQVLAEDEAFLSALLPPCLWAPPRAPAHAGWGAPAHAGGGGGAGGGGLGALGAALPGAARSCGNGSSDGSSACAWLPPGGGGAAGAAAPMLAWRPVDLSCPRARGWLLAL
ncbi:MAG: hypothetical protein J3K34DRAFT_517565, partial [Monoraphidium minutum]